MINKECPFSCQGHGGCPDGCPDRRKIKKIRAGPISLKKLRSGPDIGPDFFFKIFNIGPDFWKIIRIGPNSNFNSGSGPDFDPDFGSDSGFHFQMYRVTCIVCITYGAYPPSSNDLKLNFKTYYPSLEYIYLRRIQFHFEIRSSDENDSISFKSHSDFNWMQTRDVAEFKKSLRWFQI